MKSNRIGILGYLLSDAMGSKLLASSGCTTALHLKAAIIVTKIKDAHREKAPSNKTPVLTKSTNMAIWVVGVSDQLFIRGS